MADLNPTAMRAIDMKKAKVFSHPATARITSPSLSPSIHLIHYSGSGGGRRRHRRH